MKEHDSPSSAPLHWQHSVETEPIAHCLGTRESENGIEADLLFEDTSDGRLCAEHCVREMAGKRHPENELLVTIHIP